MRSQPRPRTKHRLITTSLLTLALSISLIAPATAIPSAGLAVRLIPEQLGRSTTIEFGVRIAEPSGAVPPPVTKIEFYYPEGFGIVTSGLGLATCTTSLLEIIGATACPSQSLMGYGTATGDVQVGPELIEEAGTTAVFMAPFQNGNIALQFYLNARTPLLAQLIFPGLLLPASAPFGGALEISVPLIASFPDGPDVALVKLYSTIGPLGLTYYDQVHHKFVPYNPSGILLPRHCPRRGFPFAAHFTFAEGTETTAHMFVACPKANPGLRAER